jgi:hypothetical protein
VSLALALALPGCVRVHAWERQRLAAWEMSSDNSGLSVLTLGGAVAQPISEELTATLRGMADRIVLDRTVVEVRAVGRVELTHLRYEQLPCEAILGKVFQLGLLGSY